MDARQEEYDKFYTDNPNKWAGDPRNEFAFKALMRHVGAPVKNFIDVGCGNGHTVEYFSKRWEDAKPWGLDLSQVGIDLAKKRVPTGTFLCVPLESLKPIMKFDVVLALGVLEHFEDHSATLSVLRKLTGNLLYVEVPNCIGYRKSVKKEGFRRIRQGNRQLEWHLFRPSWEKLFTKYGFEIVESFVGPSQSTEFIWVLK